MLQLMTPDVFTSSKRSEVMSRVRSRGNKATELAMVKILRRHLKIPGTPDFPKYLHWKD